MDKKWERVLIDWINCLKLTKQITNLNEIRTTNFFDNVESLLKDSDYPDKFLSILETLQATYKNFILTSANLSEINNSDLIEILSLLLHYTCIQNKNEFFKAPLCTELKEDIQVCIRTFLEKVTTKIDNKKLSSIIASSTSSVENSPCYNQKSIASPLVDFLKCKSFKLKMELMNDLKSELDQERQERIDIENDLKLRIAENKKLERMLELKSKEVSRLENEVLELENRTPPNYQDKDSREMQRRLKMEIQDLENHIAKMNDEELNLMKTNESLKDNLKVMQIEASEWEKKYIETDNNYQQLTEQFAEQRKQLERVQINCKELQEMLNEFKPNESIDDSRIKDETFEDLAHSVVDVQLKECQIQNSNLLQELNQVNKQLETYKTEIDVLKQKVALSNEQIEELKNCQSKQQAELEQAEQTISNKLKELDELQNTKISLQNENLQLSKTCSDLQISLEEKVELLALNHEESIKIQKSFEERIETLKGDKNKLSETIESLKMSLNQCNNDIKKAEEQKGLALMEIEELSMKITALNKSNLENTGLLEMKQQELELMKTNMLELKDNYENKLKILNEENMNLSGQLEQLQMSFSNSQVQIESLSKEITNLKLIEKTSIVKIEELHGANESLSQTIVSYQQNMASLKEEIEGLSSAKNELQGQLELALKNFDQVVTESEEIKTNYQKTLEEKEFNLIQMTEKNEKLSQNIKNLQVTMDKICTEKEDFAKTNNILKKEIEDLTEKISSQEACIDFNKKELEMTNIELDSLKVQIEELSSAKNELQEQLEMANKKFDQVITENEEIKTNYQKALEEKESNLIQLTEENKKLSQNIKNLQDTMDKINTEKDDFAKTNNILKKEVEDLTEKLSSQEACIELNKKELEMTNNELASLKVQIEDLLSAKNELQEQLEMANKNFDQVITENEEIKTNYQKALEEKESNLIQLTEENKKLSQNIKNLQVAMDKVNIEKEDFAKTNNILKKEIEDLTEKLSSQKACIDIDKKELEIIKNNLTNSLILTDNLKSDLQTMQETSTNLKQDLDLKEEQFKTSCAYFEEQIEEKNKMIENLNDTLDQTNEKLSAVLQEQADYKRESAVELQEMTKSIHEVVQKLNSLKIEHQALTEEKNQLETSSNKLILTNEDLKKDITNVSNHLKKTEQELKEVLETNQDLKNNLDKITQKLEEKNIGYVELESTLKMKNGLCNDLEEEVKDLQNKLKEMDRKVQELLVNNLELNKNNKKLQEEYSSIKLKAEQTVSLLEEVTLCNNKIKSLEEKLSATISHNETLLKDLNLHRNDAETLFKKCQDLESLIKDKERIEMEKDIDVEKLTKENEDLKLNLQSLSKSFEDSTEKIEELQVLKQKLEDEVIELKGEVSKQLEIKLKNDDDIEDLKQKALLQDQLLKQKNEELEQHEETKASLELIKNEKATIQADFKAVEIKLHDLEKLYLATQEEKDECIESIKELKQSLNLVKEEKQILEKQLEAVKLQLADNLITKDSYNQMLNEKEQLEKKYNELSITILNLEAIIQPEDEDLVEGTKKILDKREKALELLQNQLKQINDENINLSAKLKELQLEIETACQSNTKFKKSEADHLKAVSLLETELETKSISLSALEKNLAASQETQKKLEEKVTETQNNLKIVEQERDELKAKLVHLEEGKEALLNLSSELCELKEQLDETEKQRSFFEEIVQNISSIVRLEDSKELSKEIELLLEKSIEDERKLQNHQDQNRKLEDDLGILTKTNQNLQSKLLKLEEQNLKLEAALESSNKDLERIRKMRDEILMTQTEIMKQTESNMVRAHENAIEVKNDLLGKLQLAEKELKSIKETNKLLNFDIKKVREAYSNVMKNNAKLEVEIVSLRKALEDRQSKLEDIQMVQEAYEKLLEENNKYSMEIDTLKYKRSRDREEFGLKIKEIQTSYEGKLTNMKEKMLKLYRDEVNKEKEKVKVGNGETSYLQRMIDSLKAELQEANLKIEKLEGEGIRRASRYSSRESLAKEFVQPTALITVHSDSINSRAKEDKLGVNTRSKSSASLNQRKQENEALKQKGVPHGLSHFAMEDEEEMFNNKYLADLKEGRCSTLPNRESVSSRSSRLSELAWRNSMAPPHLKSSYPAETQFISPNRFREDDIKAGNICLDDSLSKLLPNERTEKRNKKDAGTTSYKKPGPPTPSKNGGRISLQGNEIHPLKEINDGKKTPKRMTPSRIKTLFLGRNNSSNLRENLENQPTTPKPRRLSNIFKRPK